MLAAISLVLNECTKPDQATPAVLVLQGLHALCQAEVSFFGNSQGCIFLLRLHAIFILASKLLLLAAVRIEYHILIKETSLFSSSISSLLSTAMWPFYFSG